MRESASFVRSPSSSLVSTEAGFILIGGWLMVPSPFFPPLRLSASLFRRLRCLALCPPAIESERAFERGSRDYVETEEDQLPKSFVCCARIGEKNGSEAETQRLCRREKRGLLLPSPITHPKVLSPRSNPNIEDEEGAWELRGPHRGWRAGSRSQVRVQRRELRNRRRVRDRHYPSVTLPLCFFT